MTPQKELIEALEKCATKNPSLEGVLSPESVITLLGSFDTQSALYWGVDPADMCAAASLIGYRAGLAKAGELQAKVAYVESMGLRFGMLKTSDRPAPYLAHEWAEDSDFERMFKEWSRCIGMPEELNTLRAELAASQEREQKLRVALETVANWD